MRISFQSPDCCFTAELDQSQTSREILKCLPLDSKVSLWGKEIYFQIGIANVPFSKVSFEVNIGDVAYWPDGKCLCVFFGATPFSKDEKPVPAIPVIVIGKTTVIPPDFDKIQSGQPIRVISVLDERSKKSVQPERKLAD